MLLSTPNRPYVLRSFTMVAEKDLKCTDSRTALDYWRARKGEVIAPRWADIDLMDFSTDVIPRMIVVDYEADKDDFRYRFFGTWQVAGHQSDMSGKYVSHFDTDVYGQGVRTQYDSVLQSAKPRVFHLHMVLRNVHFDTEILRLPLSSDGECIDKIWCIETPVSTVQSA